MTQLTAGAAVGATVGHTCVWHGAVCVLSLGHALPPLAAGVITVRTNCWVPPPHEAEQVPTAAKSLMTQSVTMPGQGCELQASSFVLSNGHGVPRLAAGVTTVRTNCCLPPPHEAEQPPEGLKSLMTQFTATTGGAAVGAVVGHACVLHASVLTF